MCEDIIQYHKVSNVDSEVLDLVNVLIFFFKNPFSVAIFSLLFLFLLNGSTFLILIVLSGL